VPFRLLGLTVDPRRAGELSGRAFSHYVSVGVQVTLACLDGSQWSAEDARRCALAIGARRLLLLDYTAADVANDAAQSVLRDMMLALRPHVVVVDEEPAGLKEAAEFAFTQARRQAGAGLPAKLYYRASTLAPASITTLVSASGTSEGFLRAYPQPWITGVMERDLFAGLRSVDEPPQEALAA
jgi:hypothetical protein